MQTDKQTWIDSHEMAAEFIEKHGLINALKIVEKLALNSPLIHMKKLYAQIYLIIFYELELIKNENLK